MWPVIYFYPDLTYSVKVFSWFCSNLRFVYMKLVKYILQYVSGTLKLGLTFDRKADTLDDVIGNIDSNFAKSKTDWKSIKNYIFIPTGVAISSLSEFQLIVTLCIYKAKYVAIYKAEKEMFWLKYLLAKLGFWKKSISITLYANNQDSIVLSNNSKFYYWT